MTDSGPMSQPRIAEALSGKRVLLTGVTGFVGEALLERILYDLPGTTVVVLVRSRGGASATQRVEHLLTKPAFERLRARYEEHGDGKASTRSSAPGSPCSKVTCRTCRTCPAISTSSCTAPGKCPSILRSMKDSPPTCTAR